MALQQMHDGANSTIPAIQISLRNIVKKSNANSAEIDAAITTTSQSVSGVNEAHVLTDVLIVCDTSSNDVEIALLPAASWINKTLNIKKTAAANSVILNPDGVETIDGAATFSLTALNESAAIISDGTNIVIL